MPDQFYAAREITFDERGRNAQDAQIERLEHALTIGITSRLNCVVVNRSVDLHDEPMRRTQEIRHERPDRLLASKL